MASKHGIWFDFDRHIDIHRNVLSGWKSSMVTPTDYTETWEKPNEHKFSVKFIFAINGYEIKITKITKVSFKYLKNNISIPDKALTTDFSYAAFNNHKNHMIRYCSPHEIIYDQTMPWHHKHHRHEFNNNVENILIYSDDDRPFLDRFKRKFPVDGHMATIQHQNIDWPHISEFLTEIYKL